LVSTCRSGNGLPGWKAFIIDAAIPGHADE
jgi:hypothetical protein